jgi:uncharacterized protein YidB (DUF937 family)
MSGLAGRLDWEQIMGMLDSVLGAAVGSALGRGRVGNGGGLGGAMLGGGRSGVLGSPVVKALIVALAAKAAQEYMTRNRDESAQASLPGSSRADPQGAPQGGFGDLLGGILGGDKGGLGGLLGGLGGAGVLGDLLEQFNKRGHGASIRSWVDAGPNASIPPAQLAEALGPDNLADLEQQTGLTQPQLLEELSRELPEAIDKITPNGRLPTDEELLRPVR